MEWGKILGAILAGLIVWLLYRGVRGNPGLFAADKMNKSFMTMGVLALGLIGFIALCVLLLNS